MKNKKEPINEGISTSNIIGEAKEENPQITTRITRSKLKTSRSPSPNPRINGLNGSKELLSKENQNITNFNNDDNNLINDFKIVEPPVILVPTNSLSPINFSLDRFERAVKFRTRKLERIEKLIKIFLFLILTFIFVRNKNRYIVYSF